jgi:exosortase A-associated hydrolase 1
VNWSEEALVFPCGGEELVGVLAIPERPAPRGVLIVVGGPQVRAGSHRQFALLARHLADAGIASLRFDYRGMGDSGGAARSFEHAQEDLRCAVDRFAARLPALRDIAIWGLCDAASAALFYGHRDPRIGGLVLVNPWVRTEAGLARAQLRHYYFARLLQASFWQKLAQGEFEFGARAKAFFDRVRKSLGRSDDTAPSSGRPLPDRMEDGLRRFKGPVLLILSGNDLTAQEFKDLVARSPSWQSLLQEGRVTRHDLSEANHTFARRAWRDRVASWTVAWLMPQRQ